MLLQRLLLSAWILINAIPTWASEKPSDVTKWGELRVRFEFTGKLPDPPVAWEALRHNADFVGDVYDESLLVNSDNRGVANVVVWLRTDRDTAPSIHPSFQKTAPDKVTWSIVGTRFVPHVLSVQTSQTLLINNKDRFGHVPKLDMSDNASTSMALPSVNEGQHSFKKSEMIPVKACCAVHPWESAWLILKDHPYVGISDADGKLKIEKLPVGDWEFQFWHERAGNLKEGIVDGEVKSWPKGRRMVAISEGVNDLGTVKVPAKLFER